MFKLRPSSHRNAGHRPGAEVLARNHNSEVRGARPPRAWLDAPSRPAFSTCGGFHAAAQFSAAGVFREGAENRTRGGRDPLFIPGFGIRSSGRVGGGLLRSSLALIWLISTLAAFAQDSLWSEPFGQFAFLPRPRQFRVTPVYSFSRADSFFDANGQKVALSDTMTRSLGLVLVEYAIRPYLAADLTLGGVAANALAHGSVDLADTQFGLRWRLLDEDLKESEPYVPTLTLRLGGVVHGTHSADAVFAPGQGASGLEARILMSDAIGETGFSIYGDFGWRWFANDVPQQFLGSAGLGYTLKLGGRLQSATANLGYAFNRSLSGGAISALPPYDWAHAQGLTQAIQAGLAATDRHGRRYQLFIETDLGGRNAAQATSIGAFVRFPFKPFPHPDDD